MKFLGREITFLGNSDKVGANKIEPTNEQVVKQLQDAALADVKAFHRQMQQAQAAQAEYDRKQARAVAQMLGQENPDEV